MKPRTFLKAAAGSTVAAMTPAMAEAAALLAEVGLDYAYCSPTSLVLCRFG
jgi:hypothetical protein